MSANACTARPEQKLPTLGRGALDMAAMLCVPGPKIDNSSLSTLGGTQYECKITTQLDAGNWWVWACSGWIGYDPTQLATDVPANQRITFDCLQTGAWSFKWYGEVVDNTPASWTDADMGHGFPLFGYGDAAYIREPRFYNGSWNWMVNNPLTVAAPGSGYDPACYSNGSMQSGSAPWTRWFYVGGGGGDFNGCN